jgi:CRP/FNR family transcriptional regulator
VLLDGYHSPANFGIIVSGVVKLLHIAEDGRQQIVGLLFPGDCIGPTQPLIAHLVAEAATAVELCSFPRKIFEALQKRNPKVDSAILSHILLELDDTRAWTRILTQRPALERVARFLVMIERRTRQPDKGQASDSLELPLLRTDLADYLGMTIETLSRQLTRMRSAGIIETSGRYGVRIKDWPRLRELALPVDAHQTDVEG